MALFKIIAAFGGFAILVFISVGVVLGGWLWPYAINTWLIWYGKTATVLWWHGALIGLIPGIGYLCVPIGLITWIAMMFL